MKQFILPFILIIGFQAASQNLDSLYDSSLESLKTKSLDSARIDALSYLSAAKVENDKFHMVKAYYILGYVSAKTEDFGNAVINYLEGARLAEDQSNKEIQENLISIYKNLANILGDHSHYDLAYKVINKALGVARTLGNEDQEIELLENKIHELVDEEKYSEAITQIDDLLSNYDQEKINIISLKNKLGIASKGLNDFERAKSNYFYILENVEKSNEYYFHALNNLGQLYMIEGNYEKAINYLEQAIESQKTVNHRKYLIETYSELAKVHSIRGDYHLAIDCLNKAQAIDDNEYTDPKTHQIYKLSSEVYEKLGQPQKALKYKNIYLKKLSEKEPAMELLTERHFDLLNAHFEKEKSQKLAYWTTAAAIAFLLISFIVFIKYYKSRAVVKKEVNRIIRNFST